MVIDSFDPVEEKKRLGYETIVGQSTTSNVVSKISVFSLDIIRLYLFKNIITLRTE